MTDLTLEQQRALAMANARMRQSQQPQQENGMSLGQQRTMAPFAGFNKGLSLLAGLPVDTAENLLNLVSTGTYAGLNALSGDNKSPPLLENSLGGSKHIESLLNKAGAQTANPNPEDMASRMLHTAGTLGGASLSRNPQALRGTIPAMAGGAAASEIDPNLTGIGSMTPALAGRGVTAGMQAISNKLTPASQNLNMFRKAGVSPSAGLVTGGTFFNGLENLLSKFPGGAGVMQRFREGMQKQLGSKVSTGVSAEDAGRAIERGVTGKGGFLEKTSAAWRQLDDTMAKKVKPGTAVVPTETLGALGALTAPVKGAERTTKGLVNPKWEKMRQDLEQDLADNNGILPFEALRALRTRVGTMVEDALVSGVAGGEAKKLYASLSRDLEASAKAGGAYPEFLRQQQYWAARMGRIEKTLDRVIGTNKQPEEIFRAFMPKDPNQHSTARAVMRSLPPDERRIVSQAVVDRLGRATPGKQNEVSDVFSSETFLTNYAKLSPQAKSALFPDPKMRENVDAVAAAASNIRHGATSMSNPSGTAGSFAGYAIYFAPIAFLAGQGNMKAAAAAAAIAGAANFTARMMTNPKFVNWLASAPKTAKPEAHAAHMQRLAAIYNGTDDEALKADLDQYITSLNGEQ